MRVMVIMKASAESEAEVMPSERMLTEMMQFNEELVKAGVMLAGEGLRASARGTRVRFEGQTTTVVNGPFAAPSELIAGFWIWRVASMDEAVSWARRIPNTDGAHHEVEIREVFEAQDFGDAMTPELRDQEARLRAETDKLQGP
jgi:hypothetical protein